MQKSAYIIILNYNGGKWLGPCLESVRETTYGNYKVLLVDNCSEDGSVTLVRERFPEVEVLVNESNLGFSEGNNRGIERGLAEGAEYIVLLNPDTMVEPEWLDRLVATGESEESAGVLGAVQMSYDGTDFNSWTRTAFPELLDELSDPGNARSWISVEWVEGACLAVKRRVLERIGVLDPIYYAFYEEIDLCRRAICAGYSVALVPGARIRHYRGGMWQADAARSRERDYRCDRSQFIFNLTDPRRPFFGNLAKYFQTLLTKANDVRRDFSLPRLWDLMRIQFDLLIHLSDCLNKWQRERLLQDRK